MTQERTHTHLLSPQISRPLVLFLFCILFVMLQWLQRPDALLNPHFFAEDGRVWYHDAYYHGGAIMLFIPQDGYFQTLSRIGGALAVMAPLAYAPLLLNTIALALQTLPALFILTSRFNKLIPAFLLRILIALLYILLPNTEEIHANITNSQWHLALLAFMVLIAEPGANALWRMFDKAILLLSVASGPFAFFLFPLVFMRWRRVGSDETKSHLMIVAFGIFVQSIALFLISHGSRLRLSPDLSSLPLIFSIFEKQVVWGVIVNPSLYTSLVAKIPWLEAVSFIGAAFAIGLILYMLAKGPLELKLFSIFAALIFATSLIFRPVNLSTNVYLETLLKSNHGIRYWLIPMMLFTATLVWCALKANTWLIRIVAYAFLVLMPFGMIHSFKHRPYTDYQFQQYAQRFETLSPGEIMEIPVNPSSWGWVKLQKR